MNVLIGSGFTTAIARAAGVNSASMSAINLPYVHAELVKKTALKYANGVCRNNPNIEDQIRSISDLIGGLRVLSLDQSSRICNGNVCQTATQSLNEWRMALERMLLDFLWAILKTECDINKALVSIVDNKASSVRRLIAGFLLPFASRAATRDRTHIFTTNYDRLIEYGCDLLGVRMIDRFIGNLTPVFHSSRLSIDVHYNPPGIRGEPRYLEGVVRFSKLHGSVDWRGARGPSGEMEVQRRALPFGANRAHPEASQHTGGDLLVYPNATKDVETLEYPYAELFRDFAAALCQPNAVVVTYGYGFGDDHVNRVLQDMLSIPSTHLVIISYNDADGRLGSFYDKIGHEAQITLLVGPHFGRLDTLVEHYLPKPAIDRTTWRMVDLLNRRTPHKKDNPPPVDSQNGDAD